jgi:hypothetical protein
MTPQALVLIADLDDYRLALQSQFRIAIDLRVFCQIAAVHPQFGPRLASELGSMRGIGVDEGEAAQLLGGILWPQALEVRSGWQQLYHPFRKVGPTERQLTQLLFAPSTTKVILLDDSDWRTQIAEALKNDGMARLSGSVDDKPSFVTALMEFTVEPIDVGWLLLYAAIEGIELRETSLSALLYLRELG